MVSHRILRIETLPLASVGVCGHLGGIQVQITVHAQWCHFLNLLPDMSQVSANVPIGFDLWKG